MSLERYKFILDSMGSDKPLRAFEYGVRKRDSRTKKESLGLSPTISKPRQYLINLIAILVFPKNVTLNQSIWNSLISTSEVNC